MTHHELPADLLTFLSGDHHLDYDSSDCEIGRFSFHRLADVRTIELLLSTHGDDWIADDPHNGEGHYIVDAFDLLADCDGYDPEGLFVFVPKLATYASFDCDHESLVMYPNLSWAQFAADPVRYINAAWGPDPDIAVAVNPIGQFPHRP
ncbi:hypothetical protein [Novipirellula caenicola]|uniref:Uncharacterized protein n=1 Tax=Novipirellula caenicola TaxID=1536901 RepID=A0ABP9VUR4_9BACT